MLNKNMSKKEIETLLQDKGEFIQIDYLNRFLNESLSLDNKKFVFLKLAQLYKKLKMPEKAAREYRNAAMVSITFSDKINFIVEEAKMHILSGNFEKVDDAKKRAISQANSVQKKEIIEKINEAYIDQAKIYEKDLKKVHEAKIYEKIIKEPSLNDIKKKEIKERLFFLYDKLGKRKPYII